jgi:hypothetical protein
MYRKYWSEFKGIMFIYLNDVLSSAKVIYLDWYRNVITVRAMGRATEELGFSSEWE